MKKLIVIVIAITMLVPFTSFAETSGSDVAQFIFLDGITFGMTRDEIMEHESDVSFDEYDNYIAYSGFKSAGKESILCYFFDDGDNLDKIYVMYTDGHTNSNQYIDDFNTIDKALHTKYGTPSVDGKYNWSNSLYKDDPEYYGLALSMGYLTIFSTWVLDNVNISHIILGDNYKVSHSLLYTAPEYKTTTDTNGI